MNCVNGTNQLLTHSMMLKYNILENKYLSKLRKHRTMEKVQKSSNSVCYTPSSQPYKICLKN
jgi:hypothetical protein